MRVLFIGDLAATGFGSVTTDLGRALLDLDLDVRFLSQNDLGAELPEPFSSRTLDMAFWMYQMGNNGAQVAGVRSVIGEIIGGQCEGLLMNGTPWGDWKPEAAILLGDFFAVRLLDARFGDALRSIPCLHYCPVEGIDLPPLWAQMWARITPVSMSRFGQREIAAVIGREPAMAYHGIDAESFHPVGPSHPLVVPVDADATSFVTLRSKEACRAFFGWDPKKRYILRTDSNMPRKRHGSLLRALGPVLLERPDVTLVLHCRALDQGGFLPDDVSKLPVQVQRQIMITDRPGLPREVLVAMYNAADVYCSTSAEGFGLTIAEAIACGVPAVGLDYSAVPEVIGPAGVVVPVSVTYENEYSHWWAWPDEDAYGKAVAYLLDHPARARALGAEGPKHVARTFRWSDAAEVFARLMTEALTLPADMIPPEAEDFVFVPQKAMVAA